MEANDTAHRAAVAEIQRLMRENLRDEDNLVEALLVERREATKIEHAKLMADGSIPLAERLLSGTPLSEAEKAALRKSGLDPDVELGPENDPSVMAQRGIARILLSSLTVEETAKLLRTNADRVLSMSTSWQLYSLQSQYGLQRFPQFQFTDDGLVPGFDVVAPYLSRDHLLIEIVNGFSFKDPDLFREDDVTMQAFSPREWLTSGHHPASVIERLDCSALGA